MGEDHQAAQVPRRRLSFVEGSACRQQHIGHCNKMQHFSLRILAEGYLIAVTCKIPKRRLWTPKQKTSFPKPLPGLEGKARIVFSLTPPITR